MLFTKLNEETSKQGLLAIVKEMSTLDSIYPELKTPGKIRGLLTDDNFNAEERPWDFLVALAYSTISISSEKAATDINELHYLQKRIDRILKYPMKWMYDAITPDMQRRYLAVAGESFPRAVRTRRRPPRSITEKCTFFNRDKYDQLQYLLRRIRCVPYIVQFDVEHDDLSPMVSVREMHDLIASMKKPPQNILAELNQKAIVVEQENLCHALKRAQASADSLGLLHYVASGEAEELKTMTEIAKALGVDINFTE